MELLLFIIYVLSKQNKLIKFNNKYIFMEKTLVLGDKKQEFIIENNLIKLSNGKYLCTDEKKVVECKNKPSKWDLKNVGNIYKIFTKVGIFNKKKCWEVVNNKIEIHKCEDKISQKFDVIDFVGDENNKVNSEGTNNNGSNDNKNNEINEGSFVNENFIKKINNHEKKEDSSDSFEDLKNENIDINKMFIQHERKNKEMDKELDFYEKKNELDNKINKNNCTESNKMKRATEYIQKNFANHKEVLCFYMNIERYLNCK